MKLIEGLKELKLIDKKVKDLVSKIQLNSARLSSETSPYQDPKAEVASWMQSSEDLIARREGLLVDIYNTNMKTLVTIKLGENNVTKSVAAWVVRRRSGVPASALVYAAMTDRNLKETEIKQTDGTIQKITIERSYDTELRDKRRSLLMEEPFLIDSALEIVNATTDIIPA